MEQYEDDWDDVDRLWASGAPWRLYEADAEQLQDEEDDEGMLRLADELWDEPESDAEKVEEAQSLRFLDRMRGK
jgi:hypothetical protein